MDFLSSINEDIRKNQEKIIKVGEKIQQDKLDAITREEEGNALLKEITINQKEQILNQEIIISALTGQLKSVNHTLDLILNSIGVNAQKSHVISNKNNELILELQQILIQEQIEKGSGKLKKFIEEHGFEAIAVILQLISMTSKSL